MNRLTEHLGVLVTRPQHQADRLCRMITEAGFRAIPFPTIQIEPPTNMVQLERGITSLAHYDIAIFLSANTVRYCSMRLSNTCKTNSERPKIAAIGLATQKALQKAGLSVDLLPDPLSGQRFNSEGLLALPELQCSQLSHKKIILFAGESGRELLANTLKERGATITKIVAYRRIQPQNDPQEIIEQLNGQLIDIVICTSNESLSNLFAMFPLKVQTTLINLQLLGVNERILSLARQLGLKKHPIIAEGASDDAIVKTLRLMQVADFRFKRE